MNVTKSGFSKYTVLTEKKIRDIKQKFYRKRKPHFKKIKSYVVAGLAIVKLELAATCLFRKA